jgi:hypothetical protein
MEILFDILKLTIPAVLVLITAWMLIGKMIRNDQERRRQEIVLQNNRTIAPIRLQAYERIILFLERTSIESLLMRTNKQGMSASQLHSAILNAIRSEYEHNLSQQIYMTQQAWEVVKNARSNTIKIVNNVAAEIPETASAVDLSRGLLEKIMELDKEPTQAAIEYVKGEAMRLM